MITFRENINKHSDKQEAYAHTHTHIPHFPLDFIVRLRNIGKS